MTTIRILVADDHALVREGIRLVLDAEPEFEVVAEAANGRQAVDLALVHRPDVVVLDITMPEETGLSAAARLRDLLPSARVLLLSMHDQTEYVREGIRIGTVHWSVGVTALAEKRGPASLARTLYAETAESAAARQEQALQRRLARPLGADLGERPTKQDRRRLDALRRARRRN